MTANIREVGMDVQMLRQLIMGGNVHTVRHFLDERIELMNDEKRRIERNMKFELIYHSRTWVVVDKMTQIHIVCFPTQIGAINWINNNTKLG